MNKYQKLLLKQCRVAMTESVSAALQGKGVYNDKESLLSYFDHAKFFGKDVVGHGYSDTTSAINRLCELPETGLIKLHKSAGSWARYTFKKEIVEEIINAIE